MADYLMCEIRKMDIWDIEIVCGEHGCIKKVVEVHGKRIKDAIKIVKKSTGQEIVSRRFRRKMSNYSSIGIDARIGLGFDKSRSTNRYVNKIVYAWEGIKKFIRPTANISTIIDKMERIVEFEHVGELVEVEPVHLQTYQPVGPDYVPRVDMLQQVANGRNHQDMVMSLPPSLFRPPGSMVDDVPRMFFPESYVQPQPIPQSMIMQPQPVSPRRSPSPKGRIKSSREVIGHQPLDPSAQERYLNGYRLVTKEVFQTSKTGKVLTINPINLICLNIPSYAGGIAHMWNKSSIHSPIVHNGEKVRYEKKQEMGDGEVEFLSFTGKIKFGVLERLLTGGGKRVAQGGGPFLITFKQSDDPINKPMVTYAQVDGEYMQLINPTYYRINLSVDLPRGKINALFKGPNTPPHPPVGS